MKSAVLAAIVVAVGCKNAAEDGQVVIQLHSTMGNLIDRIEIYGELGTSAEGYTITVAGTSFPVTQSILFGGGSMLGPLVVGATGYRGDVAVVNQEWSTTFLPNESRVVNVELTELCAGVICSFDERTCSSRGCVPWELNAALLPVLSDELPSVEACNDADDDGDGLVDESFGVPETDNNCGTCGVPCLVGTCDLGRCVSSPVVGLGAGGHHACAVHADGSVTCWGSGGGGETGDPLFSRYLDVNLEDDEAGVYSRSRRQALPVGAPVTQVDGGGAWTCTVTNDRRLICSGSNYYGQLGLADAGYVTVVPQPSDLTDVTQVSGGVWHNCVLLGSGEVRCFGSNTSGQAGGAALTQTQVTKERINVPPAAQISSGGEHSCAVTTTGAVHCWGANGSGQLGAEGGPAPVIAIASGAAMVAAGDAHTCAALTDGSVQCWGDNGQGQLGTPGISSSPTPVPVPGVSGIVQVHAAHSDQYTAMEGPVPYTGGHTCAVTNGGAVVCWGDNEYGQLGVDPMMALVTPPTMLLPSGARTVATSGVNVCVLLEDGRTRCYGPSYLGGLGDWCIDGDRYAFEGVEVLF